VAANNAMQLSALAQAGLDRFRAAFAASQHLSDEELLRRRSNQPRLALHREPKPRAPRPRDREPPPKLSRQYQGVTSTLVLRDRRLTYSARVLAGWIVTLAGKRGWFETTRARLGATVGLRPRTITRLLGDLVRYGYVSAERTKTKTGADAGLRLFVMPRLLP
jgi:CRP-like cAMP-binding protein